MKIKAIAECVINGVRVIPGIHNYKFDHRDPLTADQLRIYRDKMKVINFRELLYCDVKDFDKKDGVKPFHDLLKRTESYHEERAKKSKVKEAVQDEILRRADSRVGSVGEDGGSDLGGGELSNEGEN